MAKTERLTKAKIEKETVPVGKRQTMLWDAVVGGLGVRCLPGGARTCIFRYRPLGAGREADPRVPKIGAFPTISLAAARTAAHHYAAQVALGDDRGASGGETQAESHGGANCWPWTDPMSCI